MSQWIKHLLYKELSLDPQYPCLGDRDGNPWEKLASQNSQISKYLVRDSTTHEHTYTFKI